MKKLVFIIDDDPVYLKFMKGHFNQMEEFQTQVFQTGTEALAALANTKPFLIILDHLFLNDSKTGLEYLKEIRRKDSKVSVIYITATNDDTLRAKTSKLKVDHYILKDDVFLMHLRTALDKLKNQPEKEGLLKKLFKK
ncbi:MAG: response regulator [Cyclobacteriaceae bacterium]